MLVALKSKPYPCSFSDLGLQILINSLHWGYQYLQKIKLFLGSNVYTLKNEVHGESTLISVWCTLNFQHTWQCFHCQCVQHTTWCTVHTSWKKKYSTPVTTSCTLTTVQKVVSAHFMMQVCTNHQVDSVCSTLNSASVLSTPYIECLVRTM